MNDGYYDTTITAARIERDRDDKPVFCFDVEFDTGETATARQYTGSDIGAEIAGKLLTQLGIASVMSVAVGQTLRVVVKTKDKNGKLYQNVYPVLNNERPAPVEADDEAAVLEAFLSGGDDTPF